MLSEGQVRSREQQPHLRVLAHPAASHLERAALRLAECALLQRLPADGEAGLQPLDAPQLRAERLRVLAAPQRPLLQHIRRAVELAEPRESRRLPAAQLAQLRARLVPQPLRAVGHSPLVLSEHHPARRSVAVQRAVPRLRTDRLRVEPQRLGVLASLVQRVALLSQRRGCARARTGALAAAAHTATAAAAAAAAAGLLHDGLQQLLRYMETGQRSTGAGALGMGLRRPAEARTRRSAPPLAAWPCRAAPPPWPRRAAAAAAAPSRGGGAP